MAPLSGLPILAMALSMAMHSPATARIETAQNQNSDPQFDRIVTVPFEYFKQHIFVTLSVNGRDGMVFLFDTGSNTNILDMATSEELGIHAELEVKQKGVGYGSQKVTIAAARDLDAQMDGVPIADSMTIVDLHNLELLNQHHLDGILGMPLLRRFVVEIDFANQLLTLKPAHGYRYRGSGEILGLSQKDDSLSIAVTLGTGVDEHRNATLDLDTGSDATLMLYSQFIYKSRITDVSRHGSLTPTQALACGIGGYFGVETVTVPFMTMGQTEMTLLPVFLMHSTPSFSGRRKTDGVIGTAVMALYQKVIFDQPKGRVIFERRDPVSSAAKAANAKATNTDRATPVAWKR